MADWAQILKLLKPKVKRLIANCIRHFPTSSKYIGPPKGQYNSSIEYWQVCSRNNLENTFYKRGIPSTLNQRKLPELISGQQHWKFNQLPLVYEAPETFVISIPNGRVVTSYGMDVSVITHNDRLLLDVSEDFSIEQDLSVRETVKKSKFTCHIQHHKTP